MVRGPCVVRWSGDLVVRWPEDLVVRGPGGQVVRGPQSRDQGSTCRCNRGSAVGHISIMERLFVGARGIS